MKKLILFCILILITVSCTQSSEIDVTPINVEHLTDIPPTQKIIDSQVISISSPTLTPTQPIVIPTSAFIPSGTPTPVSTLTPTPLPVRVVQNCIPLTSTLPMDGEYTGRIAFSRSGAPLPSAFLYDMVSGQKIDLPVAPNEDVFISGVSQDRKWLAYIREPRDPQDSGERRLIIADYNGQPQKIVPFQDGWITSLGWLGSTQFAIHAQGQEKFNDNVTVINPFTGEEKIFSVDIFPDIHFVTPGPWGLMYHPPIVFAPTFTHLVYGKGTIEGLGLSIWDIHANQEINFLNRTLDVAPVWSPDGQQIVTVKNISPSEAGSNSQELFLFPLEGSAQRITYLTDAYRHQKVHLSDPRWSSDNRYIAFGIAISSYDSPTDDLAETKNQYRLAVLDLHLSEVREYCVPYKGYMSPPIWSPDNRYLLLWDSTAWDQEWVYLVDLQEGFAAKMLEGYRPVGWMAGEP